MCVSLNVSFLSIWNVGSTMNNLLKYILLFYFQFKESQSRAM